MSSEPRERANARKKCEKEKRKKEKEGEEFENPTSFPPATLNLHALPNRVAPATALRATHKLSQIVNNSEYTGYNWSRLSITRLIESCARSGCLQTGTRGEGQEEKKLRFDDFCDGFLFSFVWVIS